MSEKIGEVKPYTPDEMHALCQKDERLFQSMAAMARRTQELKEEYRRQKFFLFTAVRKNGPFEVSTEDARVFKENFSAFVCNPSKTEGSVLVFDIERPAIGQEAVAAHGSEDNKPIAQ